MLIRSYLRCIDGVVSLPLFQFYCDNTKSYYRCKVSNGDLFVTSSFSLSWNSFTGSSVTVSMLQSSLVELSALSCTDLFFLDNTSFIINAQHRRDASFFLCGEASKFIYQLCFRCFTSDSVPLPSAWFLLLGFQVGDGTLMAAGEFLVRLNTTNKVASARKRKAEGVHSGERSDRALVQKTAETLKAEFVQDAWPT